ncbi:MAG: portal protein [Pyramidobacter sp.]|jgi:hypothetical protein
MDAASLRKHLESRRAALRQIEQKQEGAWKELRDCICPYRGRFSGERPDEYRPDLSKIIDSTPLTALRMLSAGMQSGLTSPSRQWFKLSLRDAEMSEAQPVQEWCDGVQSLMMRVMASSGFYRALHALYEEIAVFGTGCLVIMPDWDHVIDVTTLSAGTFYLGRSSGARIDSLYRDLWMTAGEMAAEFGEANCSEVVRSALESRRDTLFEVRHAIEPDTLGASRFPWLSAYWEPGSGDRLLRIGGYTTFPCCTPRWTVGEGDVYGYGPASEALPDVKTLMAMKRDYLTGIKKKAWPPLVASSMVLEGGVKTAPDGITYVTSGAVGPQIAPLYSVDLDLADLAAGIEQYKNDVRKSLYVDLFMMLSEQDTGRMTAREVAERHEEKMLALGPVLESLEWELLIPAIDRIFDLMVERGIVPEPPGEVQGADVKVEFVSILAQAQKMMGLSSIEQTAAFAGQIAQVDPTVLDAFDGEQAVRIYRDLVGAPAAILREPEEAEALRARREAQQQAAMQAAQEQAAAQTAQSAAQGAQSLAETPVGGGGSALDALIAPLGGSMAPDEEGTM